METATASAVLLAASSSEVVPSQHHSAMLAAGDTAPTASVSILSAPTPSQSPEVSAKDLKSMGNRFQEESHETDSPPLRVRPSRVFKGKEPATVEVEKKPLRLLDLPVDILKEIVKEVTHTNDLTSLALCHSALHRLTIPHIYSRFDIVWPDNTTHAEPRSGVDALTYGLATLVMGEEIFGEAPNQRQGRTNRFNASGHGRATETTIRRRRGNHYAHYTKKFSLGNGPAEWVQEYVINKESGKMLGTLVALAVARMRSLETFVWDMPTGILRDVWLALSSLGDRDDDIPCRLERVWVRWHDNASVEPGSPIPTQPAPTSQTTAQDPLLANGFPTSLMHPTALDRVEYPSFSVLPPLKSLSVLDIDELAYLDEMAVSIGHSLEKLRELRVGIARHATTKDWVTVWEGENLQQVDLEYPTAGCSTIGEKRLGGVLGVLMGLVCDMRKPSTVPQEKSRLRRIPSRAPVDGADPSSSSVSGSMPTSSGISSLRDVIDEVPENEPESSLAYPPSSPVQGEFAPEVTAIDVETNPSEPQPAETSLTDGVHVAAKTESEQPERLDNAMRLESLELERVRISVPVLLKAIDWSRLTSLTLLGCGHHETLWKTLRHSFAPTPKSPHHSSAPRPSIPSPKKTGKAALPASELEYHLNLKKIHTDNVSSALISFIKETLEPNSLEVLFLQEARDSVSSVTVEAIFRGPLRRHRGSLKKILIDSSQKTDEGLYANSSRWRRWILTREVLSFISSGKMPSLRELGMAIDYRDWHFFLQRLPFIPHLRSLYLPFLADHVHGSDVDPRELALQIVDVVALRPEVELCYMGIANKCFEILENRRDWDGRPESQLGILPAAQIEDDDDDDGDDDEMDDEEGAEEAQDDTESDDDTNSELDESDLPLDARPRLREILFYDDKVAVFKARYGRL